MGQPAQPWPGYCAAQDRQGNCLPVFRGLLEAFQLRVEAVEQAIDACRAVQPLQVAQAHPLFRLQAQAEPAYFSQGQLAEQLAGVFQAAWQTAKLLAAFALLLCHLLAQVLFTLLVGTAGVGSRGVL